jgi:uncharacterized protein with GYD domain
VAKYLISASYTPEGMKGVISKGGTARRDAVSKMVAEMGGTVESFYFAFGDTDAFVVADLPENVSAAAVGMAVAASGMAGAKTTVLLTPEEVDRAAQSKVHYPAPGT